MTDLGDFSDFAGDDSDDSSDAGRDEQAETAAGNGGSARSESVSEPESATAASSADADRVDAGRDGRDDPDDGGSTDAAGATGATDDADDLQFDQYDADPVGDERGVGAIAVSQGLRVSEDPDRTALRAFVTTGNRERVRLGKYLVVPYPDDELLFCRIVGLEYAQEFQADDATEIHARRAMRRPADEFEERDFKFMAELEPIAVLFSDRGDLKRRMVDRVPKPQATVGEATDATQIKTGLKIPEAGVFLGHLSVGGEKVRTAARPPTIDYRLKDDYADGDPLVFRHTLVAGGTGSGKTHASKNILRQYLAVERSYEMDDGREVQAAVVQFDPQDEYAQMHDDNPAADADDERRWEREGIAYGGHDDTVAFVPTVGNATYTAAHHDAEQIPFTVPFSMVRSRPWLAASAGLNDNQYPALQTLLSRFFDQYGNGGTYAEFCSFLDDPALKEELDESGRIHEATYEAVFRRVRGMPDGVFDQDARPITDLVEQFVKPGRLSVVPTYHVSDSRATETVVLALASLLVDEKLSSDPRFPRIADTPLLVGMDEAHNFLADADTVQARQVVGKFTDAAKQGRKERLGLFLITQDPQDVAESVFKQVNTKVVLNLGDEDAIKSVNIPPALAEKVPYMETGQMVVYSPDNSEPVELLGLPTCLTRHGRG